MESQVLREAFGENLTPKRTRREPCEQFKVTNETDYPFWGKWVP